MSLHQPALQFGALRLISALQRRQEQIRLLVATYVTAYSFAEGGGVTEAVKQIILYLKSQSEVNAVVIDRLLLSGCCATYDGAALECGCQQHGSLQANHLEVVADLNIITGLKIHIVLLSLADLRGGTREQPQQRRQVLGRHTFQ